MGLHANCLERIHHIVACLASYICSQTNARVMKFIPNEIWIMFSRFLALLRFLIMILKTLMFDM